VCCQLGLRVSARDAVHRDSSNALSSAQRQTIALLSPAGAGDVAVTSDQLFIIININVVIITRGCRSLQFCF